MFVYATHEYPSISVANFFFQQIHIISASNSLTLNLPSTFNEFVGQFSIRQVAKAII
jgi:hypothetical protein